MTTDLDLEREFADLIETLREDRPQIDPFFERELDAKVAAGFPRERRWRPSLASWGAPALALSALVAVVVGLASLETGGDFEDSASSGGGMSAPVAQDAVESGGAGATADESALQEEATAPQASRAAGKASPTTPAAVTPSSGNGSPRSDNRQARKVETSASLVLGAKPGGVQDVVNRAVEIAGRHGGFVMSSTTDLVEGGGGASLELRIRSERLQQALADLSRIADVRERREASKDITQEFVSATSRLNDARAERKGLLRQLERATDDATRDRVKAQLREVSARIAAAKTDLSRVNNRASYSTVMVTVVGDPAAGAVVDDGKWTPGDAFRDAVRVLEVAAGVLLIALAITLPLALIAALALVLVRVTRRRGRERLLETV